MEAQDGQELLDTLRQIAAERGDDIEVRFEVLRPGMRTPLFVIIEVVETRASTGKPIKGGPWSLRMKESPASGVLLEIKSIARAMLFQPPPDQPSTDDT